jgi:hypothetical protein
MATREAEVGRMAVQRQPWQIVHKTLPQKKKKKKNPKTKKGLVK